MCELVHLIGVENTRKDDYMKIAIVAGCPKTDYMAPFGDDQWEIWVLGNQYVRHESRRVTRIFEIHDNLSEHDEKYPEWLVSKEIPLIVGRHFPIKPDYNHVSYYPEKEANELLGGEYLSSSPAYMIALAILEGATEIAIYGVEMAVDDHEYFKQRPEMYAWIAYAKAKGIKITIPEESTLFKGGYVEGRDWGGKIDMEKPPFTQVQFEEMAQSHFNKMEEYEAEKAKIIDLIHSHDGARQAYIRLAKIARAIESGTVIDSLLNVNITR